MTLVYAEERRILRVAKPTNRTAQSLSRSSNRREYLAQAAISLFVAQGFPATKAKAIVERANLIAKEAGERPIAKSSFYQFFPNREALAESIAVTEKQKLLEVLDREIGQADVSVPPREVYAKAHRAIKKLYLNSPALPAILYVVRGIADTIRATQQPLDEGMVGTIHTFLRRRGAVPNTAQQYVFSMVLLKLLTTMHGLAVNVIVTPDNELKTVIDESLWVETDKVILPYLEQYGLL